MWILTFHSTCARILRREHTHLGMPVGVHDLRRRRHRAPDRRRAQGPRPRPEAVPAEGHGRRDRQGEGPGARRRRASREIAANFYEETVARGLRAPTSSASRAAGALDFDDLITETVRLFRDHPEVLEHYQERFRYLLVDEYQDTNRAQYELVNQLAARYRNVCVVGDADQGVYSWRGATIQNILDFERDYPDAAVFLMEQNYRSTQNILAVANALIEHNAAAQAEGAVDRGRRGRARRRVPGRTTSTRRRCSWRARSSACATRRASGTATSRSSTGRTRMSRVIEDVFMRVGMPYRVFGGVRFYQRKEIKDVLGYLRLLREPAGRDLVPARREHAEARDRRRHGRRARVASRATRGSTCSRRAGASTRSPCSQTRAKGAVAGFDQIMAALRTRIRGRRRPGADGRVRRRRSRAT